LYWSRLLLLKEEAQQNRDMAIFLGSAALPESEHLLYQLGWAHTTFSYHYLLRTKDRSGSPISPLAVKTDLQS
jgi:hypothetical protein